MGVAVAASPHSNTSVYGADLTTGQFLVVVLALALGTILEWYDFFVYSMLNSTLSKVFFPSNNPTVQQVSFWGVFFIGFVARPIGSVIFGHIGDTRGRRLTLLLSIVFMAVPTVLIGCLPSYAHIGVAAPVLLSLLRLVQGLAMGGEFGSALVYLHEIASKRRQGFTGSIGFASAISGCMVGVLVVMVLEVALNAQQMLVYGWRIPFLASAVSATAALALRLHMPEPREFLQERELVKEYQHDAAALSSILHSHTGPTTTSPRSSSSSSSSGASRHDSIDVECGGGPDSSAHTCSATATAKAKGSPAAPTYQQQHQQQYSQRPQKRVSGSGGSHTGSDGPQGCCARLPFVLLMRYHWAGVLLQFLFEAWVSCSFYTLSTWLPNQMVATLGLPVVLTRGMLIVNLLICVLMQLLSGHASDKGMPRLWSAISVYVIAGAIVGPVLLFGMRPGDLASAWVLHGLLLALVGWVLGIIPATCSPIYPASVRTTGFNLGHNMSMSWLGGLSPTVVTALSAVTGNKFMAPTILLVAAAGLSLIAGLALLWYAPAANRNPADAEVEVSDRQA